MSSENALLSIIVPIYNGEKYLERCLNSIINQSYSELEIILINDGSTDTTETICLEYQRNDPRVRYYAQANLGVSVARKNGIGHSHGQYIAFVDADDYLESTMYEEMMGIMLRSHSYIVECGYHQEYEEKKCLETIGGVSETITGEGECFKRLVSTGGYAAVLWNKVYSREIINVDELKEYSYSEDYLWNVVFHSKCMKKVVVQNYLYNHCININSACNMELNSKRLDSIYALIDAKEYAMNQGMRDIGYISRTILEYCTILYEKARTIKNEAICNELKAVFDETYDRGDANTICSKVARIGFYLFRRFPSLYLLCTSIYKCKTTI